MAIFYKYLKIRKLPYRTKESSNLTKNKTKWLDKSRGYLIWNRAIDFTVSTRPFFGFPFYYTTLEGFHRLGIFYMNMT